MQKKTIKALILLIYIFFTFSTKTAKAIKIICIIPVVENVVKLPISKIRIITVFLKTFALLIKNNSNISDIIKKN